MLVKGKVAEKERKEKNIKTYTCERHLTQEAHCQNGVDELVKLSSVFYDFRTTLFAQSAVNPTHKALEWLIHRYHIHQYNRDQFILLILPYHETRMFVRALQLVNLSDENDKWNWLALLQKRRIPMSSESLVARLSTDNELLKTLCNHVITATDTYSQQATCLSTLYAFYTTLVLGVIQQASTVTEVQINHILPALLRGLRSPITDFISSSYMIIATVTTKMMFNADTMEKLLLKTFKKTHLKKEATTLLLYLYQSPFNRLTVVPQSLVHRLSDLSWFVETVSDVCSTGVNASRFVVCFLLEACKIVTEDPQNTAGIQSTIDDMLVRVKLDNDAVDAILTSVLTCEFFKSEASKIAKDFLARFYQSFERSYPFKRKYAQASKANVKRFCEAEIQDQLIEMETILNKLDGVQNLSHILPMHIEEINNVQDNDLIVEDVLQNPPYTTQIMKISKKPTFIIK
ncbi:HEAT repeat-containing protein 1-like [Pseudomyrmex gracilis]|uniref:HEAT repeat-containing protein 1-like n=1 Tax=Pseudomyrmex gracilis TaxID=219809 RepID=UPI000994D7B5|nr:HEAT repeat-containing protein 1-like [Pseudomyrmex gracilis]XP_020297689.1 HEAT repeat-containing protein 1-like [Pseudomyrmex gracilis]